MGLGAEKIHQRLVAFVLDCLMNWDGKIREFCPFKGLVLDMNFGRRSGILFLKFPLFRVITPYNPYKWPYKWVSLG